MTDVVEPVNARAVYTPDGIRRATIEDPMENDAHASEYSELHASSELCGSCHAVTNPRGALIEETFPEWEASEAAAEGLQCQDCHMPEYSGQAAPDAPERTLHRHTFVGVDVSLLPEDEFPGYQEMRDLTAQLLQSSVEAEFAFDSQTRQLSSSIRNLAGHAVPSGATAERQMWLRTIVRDAQGSVVFASGTLDANGDIRDGISSHSLEPGTDPQLAYYGQLLVAVPGIQDLSGDELTQRQQEASAACLPLGRGGVMKDSGVHYVTFPWQADWQCNYMIPPDQVGEHSYDLSELAPGDYSATIELLFRTFPPYFLRLLEEETGLDPQVKERLPTVLMASDELSFSVD